MLNVLFRVSIFLVINCYPNAFFGRFPESPVWLLANHKYEQAEAALRQMARWNGVQVEGPLLAQVGW